MRTASPTTFTKLPLLNDALEELDVVDARSDTGRDNAAAFMGGGVILIDMALKWQIGGGYGNVQATKEKNDMSGTKMADVDGKELAIGDRVQIAPQPARMWEGVVVGEGESERIQVEISGNVISFARASVIKLSGDTETPE